MGHTDTSGTAALGPPLPLCPPTSLQALTYLDAGANCLTTLGNTFRCTSLQTLLLASNNIGVVVAKGWIGRLMPPGWGSGRPASLLKKIGRRVRDVGCVRGGGGAAFLDPQCC